MKRALCVLALAMAGVMAGFAGSASATSVFQGCGEGGGEDSFLSLFRVSDECEAPPAAEPVRAEDGVFLCYSKFQTIPGVWPADEAKTLLGQGYTLPQVVQGNVAGGTNMGKSFHLACNLPSVVATPTIVGYIGSDGTVFGPEFAGVAGLYPIYG